MLNDFAAKTNYVSVMVSSLFSLLEYSSNLEPDEDIIATFSLPYQLSENLYRNSNLLSVVQPQPRNLVYIDQLFLVI